METVMAWFSDFTLFVFGKDYHDSIVKWVKQAEQTTVFFIALGVLFMIIVMPRLLILLTIFGLSSFYVARKAKELIK